MKKGFVVLLLATIVFVLLRYAIPKELVIHNEKDEKEIVDDFLREVEKDTVKTPGCDTINRTIHKTEKPEIATMQKTPQLTTDTLLYRFFKKLSALEKKKKEQLRIAYFGDSMTDADMLVMQLRHYLQTRFGGMGVGFVPITSVSASGRYSIKHSFSRSWSKETFLKQSDTTFLFGVNGEAYFTGDTLQKKTANVKYRRGSAYKEAAPLQSPILFYGKQLSMVDSLERIPPTVVFADEETEGDTLSLKYNRLLNIHRLPQSKKFLELRVQDIGTTPFYGVSFASQYGVLVDNLSVRGNSGLPLSRLDKKLMRQFQKYMDYDLLILGYGTNVFSPDYEKSYAWYRHRMHRVIDHLRDCFVGADIMLVSMADRAVKEGETMQTPPQLSDFIQQQEQTAKDTQSAFFNLFDKMGGAGSMTQWVEAEEPLANKDYTHFNSKGAEKVAQFMFHWLVAAYQSYKEKYEVSKDKKQIKNESRTVFWVIQPDSHRTFGHCQLYQGVFRFRKDMVCGESSESTQK